MNEHQFLREEHRREHDDWLAHYAPQQDDSDWLENFEEETKQ